MNKIRVLFIIQTLGGGGAERVLVNLVNNMDKSSFDITVLTMFKGGVNKDLLNDDIHYICKNFPMFTGVSNFITALPSKLSYGFFVGKEKYDIVVAYMHSIPVVVAAGCSDDNTKKVGWIHCGDMAAIPKRYIGTKRAIRRWKKMDRIVSVSEYSGKEFSKYTGITDRNITVYNTNDTDRIIECSKENADIDSEGLVVCSIGRFTSEKGYIRLLKITKRLIGEGYEHKLVLIGDGKQRDELSQLTKELGIADKVVFTGFQANPYKYMTKCDLFVCSSFTEGLSTATTEALLLGLPIVSTDVSGAREILGENNEWGIVTGLDDESLYEGIKKMISSEELRRHYREATKIRASFFDTKATVKQAEDLFYEVLNNG